VSRFELFYLEQPLGGTVDVQIDKKVVRTLDTRGPSMAAGFATFDVDDGPHELRGVVRGTGPVRFFGVSLDHELPAPHPGIQVDSLGAGALSYERLLWVANGTRRVQLAHRAYDLIVIWLGMNVMYVPPTKGYAEEFIGQLRAAIPGVPILILGPSDTAHEGATHSDPRIVQISKQLELAAEETGVAFWDFREAMGGDGSIIPFTKRGLTGPDRVHFGPEGGRFMGNRLLCSLSSSFSAYLDTHRDRGAGCGFGDGGDGDAGAPR
jgi:GDSL-like Lipase/Acylhydrolase family